MPTAIAQLKRRMKFAPKMGRECRAEYLLTEVNAPPRRLSPKTLAKLKTEIVRIGNNGTRQGFKFAEKIFERYPELRGA
jgi:hypothetical protein